MSSRWLLILPVLVILHPTLTLSHSRRGNLNRSGCPPQRLERIGQVLREEIEQGRLPGAVVAVARRGNSSTTKSFGFLDKGAGIPNAQGCSLWYCIADEAADCCRGTGSL